MYYHITKELSIQPSQLFMVFICVYCYPLYRAELPIWLSFENGVIRASDHHWVQTDFLLFFIINPAENYKDEEWKYEILVKSFTVTVKLY